VSAEQDVMSAFENIFHIPLVLLIADKTNNYAKQVISKVSTVSHCAVGLGSGKAL
jgi:hypothetical protein